MSDKPRQAPDMDKEQLLEEIRNWETTDEDLTDLIHRYFERTKYRNWLDIAEEGRHLYSEMLGVDVDEFSLIDDLIGGVAAKASLGMCESMAAALGWDARILELALSHWNEADENGEYEKNTVTLEELKTLYEKEFEYWKKHYPPKKETT